MTFWSRLWKNRRRDLFDSDPTGRTPEELSAWRMVARAWDDTDSLGRRVLVSVTQYLVADARVRLELNILTSGLHGIVAAFDALPPRHRQILVAVAHAVTP